MFAGFSISGGVPFHSGCNPRVELELQCWEEGDSGDPWIATHEPLLLWMDLSNSSKSLVLTWKVMIEVTGPKVGLSAGSSMHRGIFTRVAAKNRLRTGPTARSIDIDRSPCGFSKGQAWPRTPDAQAFNFWGNAPPPQTRAQAAADVPRSRLQRRRTFVDLSIRGHWWVSTLKRLPQKKRKEKWGSYIQRTS